MQAFDFIRKFRLDLLETQYPGVTRVRGSNRMQTAYRLERDANLVLPTQDIFPLGLPEQFSFICTFRTRKLPKSPWHIIRISDVRDRAQFLITLNPRKEAIEFSLPAADGRMQTLVFKKAPVFDKGWHKIHFGVFRDRVVLYVDCEETTTEPLESRSPIDVNGQIAISKMAGTRTSV
ncbi:hypothetical protein J437_LFUL006632, partial [Ladona fulva]